MFFEILLMGNPQDPKSGGMFQLVFLVGMILIFWLFMIRPQAKKAKKQKEFINKLQKGYKVVTLAGIHGVIHKVNEDNTFDIEVSTGTYIKMEKSSISMEMSEPLNAAAEAKK